MSAEAVDKKAYTIADAAAAYGVSQDTLRRAIRRNDLAVKYPTSKPVIAAEELASWFAALPSEPPTR